MLLQSTCVEKKPQQPADLTGRGQSSHHSVFPFSKAAKKAVMSAKIFLSFQ